MTDGPLRCIERIDAICRGARQASSLWHFSTMVKTQKEARDRRAITLSAQRGKIWQARAVQERKRIAECAVLRVPPSRCL